MRRAIGFHHDAGGHLPQTRVGATDHLRDRIPYVWPEDTMNAEDRVDAALDRLQSSVLMPNRRGLRGAEIARLEDRAGRRLPSAYRRFLLRAGGYAGTFMDGSDFLARDLEDLQQVGRELMEDIGATLPADAWVFLVHQGYEMVFMSNASGASSGDDSGSVFYANDGGVIERVYSSFSEWLSTAVDEEIRNRESA